MRRTLPASIRRALRDREPERVVRGESGAEVFRCAARGRPTLYLKRLSIGAGPSLRAERDRLLWMEDRCPAPRVVEWGETTVDEFLVMTAVRGVPASEVISSPVARSIGEALQRLHAISIDDCPFDVGIDAMLAAARRNIDRHWVVEADFAQGRVGCSAEQLLREAHGTRPSDAAPVLIHGDPYPQNVLVDGDEVTGFIDWGSAGAGDRWRDLALATIVFEERAGSTASAELLAAYGIDVEDSHRMGWWRLMDELC